MKNDVFDLPLVLEQIDILADELSKLPASVDRTALELRLAQTRQLITRQHAVKLSGRFNIDPN